MSKAVLFYPKAQDDLQGAVQWYRQESPNLGDHFYQRVKIAVKVLQQNPQIAPEIENGIRGFQLRPFPYTIFYDVTDSAIRVLRIVHQHRHQEAWKQ